MAEPKAKAKPSFKVKKLITLPLLKFQIDEPIFVKFEEPMFIGKEIKGTGDKAKMEPATLANVINLETGEPCQIILATVLKSILTENYENNAYVGCAFQITKGKKASGKSYNPYSVAELEL